MKEINNPHHWWYHACKKMLESYNSSWKFLQMPTREHCQSTEKQKRYKIFINTTDIESNDENVEATAQFMFFGDSGVILTGKEPTLLAATVRGRQNFIPPAIVAIAGKKCVALAQVKQDSLDSDDSLIIFNISKVELINTPRPNEPSSSHHHQEPAKLINPSDNLQSQFDNDISSQSTPVKDILEATDSEIGELQWSHRQERNKQGNLTKKLTT